MMHGTKRKNRTNSAPISVFFAYVMNLTKNLRKILRFGLKMSVGGASILLLDKKKGWLSND
jgi:uncharacterized membrane protein